MSWKSTVPHLLTSAKSLATDASCAPSTSAKSKSSEAIRRAFSASSSTRCSSMLSMSSDRQKACRSCVMSVTSRLASRLFSIFPCFRSIVMTRSQYCDSSAAPTPR
jgi:hypothetical protein